VEYRDRPRRALQRGDAGGDLGPQRLEQLALARLDALTRGEDRVLVLLERRRDEALAVGDRLSALIVRRHRVEIGLRDFDVIPEDFVEADLERADACPLSLRRLDVRDRVLSAVAERADRIELGVDARRECRRL